MASLDLIAAAELMSDKPEFSESVRRLLEDDGWTAGLTVADRLYPGGVVATLWADGMWQVTVHEGRGSRMRVEVRAGGAGYSPYQGSIEAHQKAKEQPEYRKAGLAGQEPTGEA